MTGEILPNQNQSYELETKVVTEALGINPDELSVADAAQFDALVRIVGLFSRLNPLTGEPETISPSRINAVPAITARHMQLVWPARGELSLAEVEQAWAANIPVKRDDRHPDNLFDIAQYNFGTDKPLGSVEREIMASELRRQELMSKYRSVVRESFSQYKNNRHIDDDAPEEFLDNLVDSITRG